MVVCRCACCHSGHAPMPYRSHLSSLVLSTLLIASSSNAWQKNGRGSERLGNRNCQNAVGPRTLTAQARAALRRTQSVRTHTQTHTHKHVRAHVDLFSRCPWCVHYCAALGVLGSFCSRHWLRGLCVIGRRLLHSIAVECRCPFVLVLLAHLHARTRKHTPTRREACGHVSTWA